MEAAELLKKVRELEIKSKRLTNRLFTGECHSAFKGRGMAFKAVKEYSAGDDIRFIDWNVSARMNDSFTKVFEEELQLEVFILVDATASNLMGTQHQFTKDLITEMADVLAFSALNNNDKTGLLFFTDRVEKFIPSKNGRQHALFMVRELVSLQPLHKQTNNVKALKYLNNITRHKSIFFLLSDFADEGNEVVLRIAARRHDEIGVQVYDALDVALPNMGLVVVEDPETGEQFWLDTASKAVRQQSAAQFSKIQHDVKKVFKTAGADLLHWCRHCRISYGKGIEFKRI
jgi:uncharacterized protein (DUF58 family)